MHSPSTIYPLWMWLFQMMQLKVCAKKIKQVLCLPLRYAFILKGHASNCKTAVLVIIGNREFPAKCNEDLHLKYLPMLIE